MRNLMLLFLIVLISGCAKRKIENKFYLIEPITNDSTLTTTANASPMLEAACQIAPVEIYPAFATSRIAHRSESHQITYYTHHHWAVLPDVLLTQIIEHDLQSQNLFRNLDARLRVEPDYILESEVLQLETVANRNNLSAHLKMDFRLLDAIDQHVLLQYSIDHFEPLQKNDLNLFAEAINNTMHQELKILAGKIREELIK